MAKLKNAVPDENVEQTKEIENETANTQSTNEEVQEAKTASVVVEIPEYADKVLKMYPQYEKLAVDAQGGVYVEGSQHIANGKAILYKNPYYKS